MLNLHYIYKPLKDFLIYLFFSLIIITLYIEISHFWVSIGGFSGVSDFFDLPIIIILLLLFYIPEVKTRLSILISLLALSPLFLLHDLFYYFLQRNPVLSDFQNVTALLDFSLPLLFIGLFVIMVAYLPFFYYQIRSIVKYHHYLFILFKLVIIMFLGYLLTSDTFYRVLNQNFHYTGFSLQKTIKDNGRITSFIYYSHKEKEAAKKLKTFRKKSIDINQKLFGDVTIDDKKNIYLIVLESFIDPRLLKDIDYSPTPLSENMQNHLNDNAFSKTVSPVYGGGTSQAEFEILTGVHAYAALNSAEFNILRGRQTSGFVDVLSEQGYDNIALIASKSTYYNSPVAYKSLGFKKTLFLEEAPDFQPNHDDDRIFDGDLYTYALKKREQLKSPFLLYTLGMYGHLPYKRNTSLRPDIIKDSTDSENIHKISNQFYYRTKALSKYIDHIIQTDKNAVILVSSDHLPPILNNNIHYTEKKHINISLLLVDSKYIDISGQHYYEFSKTIMALLSHKKMPETSKDEMHELYFKLLSESYP